MSDRKDTGGQADTAGYDDGVGVASARKRDVTRCRLVEDAIYKRARGYKVAVRKTYKVKRVEYDPETGKKTSEREELESGLDEVVVPADVRAGAYWLVNRDPARWREHPRPAETGEEGGRVDFPPLEPLGGPEELTGPGETGEEAPEGGLYNPDPPYGTEWAEADGMDSLAPDEAEQP